MVNGQTTYVTLDNSSCGVIVMTGLTIMLLLFPSVTLTNRSRSPILKLNLDCLQVHHWCEYGSDSFCSCGVNAMTCFWLSADYLEKYVKVTHLPTRSRVSSVASLV